MHLLIHLSMWLILFNLGSTMTLNDFFKLTTNMTVIWDNCDIPSQLNTRSFLIGLSTHKNMSQLTSGFSDNPRAVFSLLSGGKYRLVRFLIDYITHHRKLVNIWTVISKF